MDAPGDDEKKRKKLNLTDFTDLCTEGNAQHHSGVLLRMHGFCVWSRNRRARGICGYRKAQLDKESRHVVHGNVMLRMHSNLDF